MRLHARTAGVRPGRIVLIALSIFFALVLAQVAQAQSTTEAVYQVPDQAIVDVVDVEPTPSVALGPDRDWMLFIQYPSYPPVAELAALVVLPYEAHGYRSRESLLHMLWELQEWMDRYVKNRPAETPTTD